MVILGPTATGKTDLGIFLAKKFNGEIVSCDSRQVYKGLDIGTGKLPGKDVEYERGDGFWIIDGIRVWMYDVADPKLQYTVANYVQDVGRAIDQILKLNKLPIIVGGTGLYLKALSEGMSNLSVPTDAKLREELSILTLKQLQEKLKAFSPGKWEKMNSSDRNNKRRLLRSVEIEYMYPYRDTRKKFTGITDKFNILKIGLMASKENLNKRIDLRVLSRLNSGMINEARRLQEGGLILDRMRELGLEYRMLADFLDKKISKLELEEKLKIKIHQYAKRQVTWFKKEKDVIWFDVKPYDVYEKVEKFVFDWYNSPI